MKGKNMNNQNLEDSFYDRGNSKKKTNLKNKSDFYIHQTLTDFRFEKVP